MFDEGTKITLFAVAAAAFLGTMALERNAPRTELGTAVDAGLLPPLPLSAAPDGSPAQNAIASMRVELGHGFEARLLYGYVIEGHVPAADILRLLNERPDAIGLAVPGMPFGSPGMGPESQRDAYAVHLIRRDGTTETFSVYPAA